MDKISDITDKISDIIDITAQDIIYYARLADKCQARTFLCQELSPDKLSQLHTVGYTHDLV